MIYGHITLHGKPSESELKRGICPDCMKEVDEVPVDESFDDPFGGVTDWSTGCPNCSGEVFEGRIYIDRYSCHFAKKDHFATKTTYGKNGVKKGDLIIKAGQRYRKHIVKGYYIDGDGKHEGFYMIKKMVLHNKYQDPAIIMNPINHS